MRTWPTSTYFDWGVKNQGNAAPGASFYVDLLIDDTRFIHYPFNFNPGDGVWFTDWNHTVALTGQHTLKIIVDPENAVTESDETNNVWQRQFTWVPVNGWWGEYFNNQDLSGNVALVRDDPNIDFDWGTGSPGAGVNNDFSARWSRNLTFAAGSYRFNATHDDGLRLWVDDQLRLDQWDTCCRTDTVDVSLTAGLHTLRTEFRDVGGSAVARLSWAPIACGDEHLEPNNTPGEATAIAFGQPHQATICPAGDEDYYVFAGNAGDRVVIDVDAQANGSVLDTYISLLDSNGSTVLAVNDDERPGQFDSRLGYQLPHNGSYYLKVREYNHLNEGGVDYFYSIRLSVDHTNPYLAEITAPRNNEWLNPTQTTITVSADDHESGIHRVEFLWHDGNWSNPDWVWLGADYDGSDGWSWNFGTSAWPEQRGAAFYIWAFDWAGNLGAAGVWELGIDRTAPASAVLALPATSGPSFTVSWSGSDATSGIANYDVQYRDGATGNWVDWLVATTNTSANFSGADLHTYYFRSRARDVAGNIEAWPTTANGDAYTEVRPSAPSDLIFADGFESGNLSAWTASVNSASMTVLPSAALAGSQGLQVSISSNTATYLTDDRPNAEPRYRARFYFDPNTIPMVSGNAHPIFYGYSGASKVVLRVEFRFSNGKYQLRTALLNDATTWKNSAWFTISDAPHLIELDWQAATTAGANNGSLTLWLDTVQKANLTGVDNDTRRIDRIRLGPVAGIDAGTRGTYYLDAFESRRQTYIGPAAALTTVAMETQAAAEAEPDTMDTTGILAFDVGDLNIELAPLSSTPVSVEITPVEQLLTPANSQLLGVPFALQLATVDGAPLALVEQPLTLLIDYGDALAGVDSAPTDVLLQRWNESTEVWEPIPTTVDYDARTLTIPVNQSATFALTLPLAPQRHQIRLPLIQR